MLKATTNDEYTIVLEGECDAWLKAYRTGRLIAVDTSMEPLLSAHDARLLAVWLLARAAEIMEIADE